MFLEATAPESPRIKVGVSSCLLGAKVRFDGRDKRDRTIHEYLIEHFEFHPICPEADSGLGVPREPVHLVRRSDGSLRVTGVQDPQLDVTEALARFAHSRMADLAGLRGYIVKSKSPSCGMKNIPIHSNRGETTGFGRGVFTSILIENYPLLPVESEDRLHAPLLRENFLERVLIYDRWRALLESGLTVTSLIDFHNRHRFLIRAHDRIAVRRLHRIVDQAVPENLEVRAENYAKGLMNALKRPLNVRKRDMLLKKTIARP